MAEVLLEHGQWTLGVSKPPGALAVREHLVPALCLFTADSGIPAFFASMRPDIITVEQLCEGITKQDIMAKARGVIKPATLSALRKMLDPSGTFDWTEAPDEEGSIGSKRKRGGNGNNAPRITLEDQLKEEGVEPLNPATFRWGAGVFHGVALKGQAPSLNPFLTRLFDNTWLAQQKVCSHRARTATTVVMLRPLTGYWQRVG